MSSGEWLSSPRTPGVVSLRLAKYVENSQMDTRISWPQGKVGSYSALKNTLVRKHCEFWPYPTPYMVSHPFPLKLSPDVLAQVLSFIWVQDRRSIKSRLPTSPPRSYLTPSLVAGAGRKHLPDGAPKPQTKWQTIREQIHEHA